MVFDPQKLILCANPKELTWSIILEDGTDHCTIKELKCKVPIVSRINGNADNKILPRMWFECFGRLAIKDSAAIIT